MDNKYLKKNWILITAVIFSPLIIALILLAIQAIAQGEFLLPMPAWNDEGAYYSLVKTWLATGQPLGYYGFNGGHAILGTGSGWSFAIIAPYALFGRIFSLGYHSVFFANVFFLCLAHGIFLWLTKPEKQKLIRILILQFTSVISILYITTSMSEPLRYGMAIVLAGMFYRLFFLETGKIFKFVILPIYILLISQVYIFLVFSVMIYMMGILKEKKIWVRLIWSFLTMAFVAGGSYYFLHLISSNYNIYKTENLFQAIREFDILGAVVAFLKNVKDGIYSLYSICDPYVGHGMFLWFVPLCILFVALPFFFWFIKRKENKYKKTDVIIYAIVAYSVGLFVFMYISVYSLERFTFFRGTGIVILFAMYLMVMLEEKKIYYLFGILFGIGIVFLPMNLQDFSDERYLTKQEQNEWTMLEEELTNLIPIVKTDDPWENTIAVYTLEPRVLASIPAGAGINMMMDSTVFVEEAAYILLPIKDKSDLRGEWLEANYQDFESSFREDLLKYEVIYDDREIRLYKQK